MNLADPRVLRAFLDRHGLIARKGLGQHFLHSAPVVAAILRSAEDVNGILEIGPGPGVLTSALSGSHPLIAIEIDDRMIAALQESAANADVRKADALESDLADLLSGLPEPRAVVSNLPYYITGPLITRIADASGQFKKAILMMQKEVADRILAKPGDSNRGSLSVFLEAKFELRKVTDVPPGAFLPPPKVSSAVLELSTRVGNPDSEAFFRFVRGAFRMPRKTLVNNLVAATESREAVEAALLKLGLDARIRPQMLFVEDWRALYLALSP